MLSKKLVASLLDGALQDHPTYIGGQFRGYYIIIEPDYQTRSQRIDICAYSDSDPGNARLSEFLHQIKPEFGALNHAYVQPYSCSILLTAGVNKKLVELADPLIRRIADYLAANGYQSGCMLCGLPVSTGNHRGGPAGRILRRRKHARSGRKRDTVPYGSVLYNVASNLYINSFGGLVMHTYFKVDNFE